MNLAIFHNNKNLTSHLFDLTFDALTIDLETDSLLIGYYKPISNLYVEMSKRVDEEGVFIADEIDFQIQKSTGFEPLEVFDRTYGLTGSGLISWDNSGHVKSTANGQEMYWIKLTTKTPALVKINGINLVLSNDKDLIGFFPTLLSYLPTGRESFIGFHQEARNRIVQHIRSSKRTIKSNTKLNTKNVDQFDLLNIEEFKQASKYLSLALIYSFLSRDDGDKFEDKKIEALAQYEISLDTAFMSIDLNDNGKDDESYSDKVGYIRIVNV